MITLGVILARAGSKGLPDKCVRTLRGRPVIAHTFDHVTAAPRLTAALLTTDSDAAKAVARQAGIEVVDRPAELASDSAPVDAAARHAVCVWEARHQRVVNFIALLYGNIPVRSSDLIDRAICHMLETGADSVRSVALVTKQHPDWIHRLDGDRMVQFRPNSIYRRQDLQPLFYHDGAIAVVTRTALFGALETPDDHQAFLGRDRRAIVQQADDSVDIDGLIDLRMAEAILEERAHSGGIDPSRERKRPVDGRGSRDWSAERRRRIDHNAGHVIGERPPGDALRACLRSRVPQPFQGWGTDEVGEKSERNESVPHPQRGWGTRDDAHAGIDSRPLFHGRTYVVAEAGVNHNGCVETALKLVDIAVDSGADAVKFQMFRATQLVTATAPTADYQNRGASHNRQLDMLTDLELTQDEFQRIRAHCRARSIDFLATPFSVEEVARLSELQPVAIKIASPDLTNRSLLTAAAKTGLPVIVSTGAATEEEIRSAVADLREVADRGRLTLLHCVSCYPTPIEAINLRAIGTLRQRFGVACGLSDHTVSTSTGGWAVAAGACLLEKHFTYDPSAPGPDHAMSLNPAQLSEYVSCMRSAEQALGDGGLGFNDIETEVRRVARRSVVSTESLAAGITLTASMLTLKRPGTGIPPERLKELIGRRTRQAIPADTMVSLEMLE